MADPVRINRAFLPCPICGGDEGCDHTLSERRRAATARIFKVATPLIKDAGK